MFPQGVRNVCSYVSSGALTALKASYSLSRNYLWIAASTATIAILPVVFENERASQQEQQIQQQRQVGGVFAECISGASNLHIMCTYWVGELLMGFQDVEIVFPPHLLKIVVEVKASGPPHVLKLRLGVRKGILVRYYCSNKSSFYVSQISLRSQGCHTDEVNLATLIFGDFTGCRTVAPVCLKVCCLVPQCYMSLHDH